jgi:hypothetical protein
MDFLDRIAAVLRAFFGQAESPDRASGSGPRTGSPGGSSARPADPDLAAAWDELNDYLGADRRERGEDRAGGDPQDDGRGRRGSVLPPESLRPDYANLEVPFGADIGTVRRSYKRLMLSYHPDRHAGTPEKARVATEISKRINESFERIRSFQERTGTVRH